MFTSTHRLNPQFTRTDAWLGAALALCAAAIGGVTIWRNLYVDIYQVYMPDVLYYACGYGWTHPPVLPKPVIDFLFSRVLSFECSKLSPPDSAVMPGIFIYIQPYLAWCAAMIWRFSSPEYRNLWPLAAVLVGSFVGGCFVLCRLYFSRWLAVTGATILMMSPIGLSMVVSIRDYSKAPFFIWSFVFLLLAVRARTAGWSIVYASVSGIVVGLGCGFRSDIIIMLPIGLVLLIVMWPTRGWAGRGVAIVGFVAAALIFAPNFLTGSMRGNFGSLLMQGLTEPYQRYLGLGPAPYSFGSRYSDELTLSSIAADLSADDPLWGEKEGQPDKQMTRASLESGSYTLTWLPFFAADMITQSYKSALWILGMPALVSPARLTEDFGVPIFGRPPAGTKLAFFYDAIGQPWLPWVGLAGLCMFLWQVSATDPRESIALTAVFGMMLGYTVVQFAIRHIFHLEFLWIFAAAALLRSPFMFAEMRQSFARFTIAIALLVFVLVGLRFALIEYQDSSLRAQFDALLAQPRQNVVADIVPLEEAVTLLRVPVADAHKALVSGPADSMDNTMGERGMQWRTIANADRLLLTVGGQGCPPGKLTVTARYTARPTVWQRLDHDISVDVDGSAQALILIPAFYRATQHFDGFAVATANASCIARIDRINGATRLPVILSAVLEPEWRTGDLHRAFGHFPVAEISQAQTFKPHVP